MENHKIVNYKDGGKTIEIRIDFDNQTAWLSNKDISYLFERDVSLIRKYVKELVKNEDNLSKARQAKFASLLPSGREIKLTHYSLNIICSIGLKLHSNKGKRLEEFVIKYLKEFDVDNSQIIIFNNGLVTLDVNVSPNEETVWLNEKQIADLFQTSRQTVNFHIRNILKEKELNPDRCCKDFLRDIGDGRQFLIRFHNLDMVLAIGYRIKSEIAIQFRKWASRELSKLLIKGEVRDERRCLVCQNEILKLRNDVNEIKLNQRQEIMYFKGESLRGFIEIKRFLETAKKEIIIIDNYFSKDFDEVLKNINVRKIVITNNNNEKVHESSFYELYKCNDFHGRYIFVDDVCYHSDPSFKDIGNHDDLVTKLNEPSYVEHIKNVVQTITNRR